MWNHEHRVYQAEGIRYLVNNRRALLGDDPGLGKSRQAVVACDTIGARDILVLCPSVARPHWLLEFEKYSIMEPVWTLVTTARATIPNTDGVIISYDLAIKPALRKQLLSRRWDCLVLDEMHKLAGRKSQRTELVYRDLGHRVPYVWGLSGTPARKTIDNLWPWLSFTGVYPGTYWDFVYEFCEIKEDLYGKHIVGTRPGAEQAVRAMLAQCMLRRERKDVMSELPAITFYDVVVEPAPVDFRLWYPDVALGIRTPDQVKAEIAGELRTTEDVMDLIGQSGSALDALKGMQKKTEKSRRYVGLSKVPPVAELIHQELTDDAYQKIVIFAWHSDVIQFLRMELKDFHAEVLYGGTSVGKRAKVIRDFQTDVRTRVLICNIQAAGVAIDLTAATEVAFVEASYVPTDNAQAMLRVHRYPQTKPVRVRFFSVYKHVDFRIHQILRRNSADLVAVFDTPAGAPITAAPIINPFE